LLLGHAVGVGRTAIVAHPQAPVGLDAAVAYRASIARREAGEPVAYIRGLKEFHGLAFEVDARALIPRPETELVVDLGVAEILRRLGAGVREAGAAPVRVVDVGTGSGAIAVAVAVALRAVRALDEVDVLAVDVSPDALDLAKENAVAHAVADRVRFAAADLLPQDGPDAGPFDVILANLPYVRDDAMASLPVATSFEPVLALDGGGEGLAIIERLLVRLPDALAPEGVAILEIGSDQGDAIRVSVARLLPGWSCVVEPDLAGQARVAWVRRA
jgi:release factor glutamine methyltransferase